MLQKWHSTFVSLSSFAISVSASIPVDISAFSTFFLEQLHLYSAVLSSSLSSSIPCIALIEISSGVIPSSSIVPMDDVGESIEDSAKTPEELLMCREQLDQLLLRLQSVLSKSEYDVLMLYGNGLSYKEIAEKLSVTEKAVDNALQRARKKVHGGLNVG